MIYVIVFSAFPITTLETADQKFSLELKFFKGTAHQNFSLELKFFRGTADYNYFSNLIQIEISSPEIASFFRTSEVHLWIHFISKPTSSLKNCFWTWVSKLSSKH
jgi:hypothetical protein